jgi:3-deoxy-D-manno-octulosonic-acid transferase
VPILLVNARLSEKSAHGYAKLGSLVQEGLNNLTAVGAQTELDTSRLQKLGAGNISTLGNLKFDVIPPENATEAGRILRNNIGQSRPVLLAASTREGEEAMILDALATVHIPNLITVIVPRHPQRFNDVEALLKKQGCNYVRRSSLTDGNTISQDVTYVLGDSMGEMFTYYSACDIAFIGGSLLPLGGQNLIEALSMRKPVLIGPHTFNFEQATKLATEAGAAIQVQNIDDLGKNISALFNNTSRQQSMTKAALDFTAANQGATTRTLGLIEQFINANI